MQKGVTFMKHEIDRSDQQLISPSPKFKDKISGLRKHVYHVEKTNKKILGVVERELNQYNEECDRKISFLHREVEAKDRLANSLQTALKKAEAQYRKHITELQESCKAQRTFDHQVTLKDRATRSYSAHVFDSVMSFKETWPKPNLIHQLSGYEDPASLISEGICYARAIGKDPKVAVIGAGPAGLCAARHLFAEGSGFTGVVFEQKSTIGGTWVYTDETVKDKYGQPVHSPLYHGLETNLPKEVMEFPDFPYEIEDKSYLSSEEVLEYLNKYATHFNLLPHIKLNHLVKRVAPVGKTWSLTALDLETQIEHVSLYDAIVVCSGPTSIPVYPKIEGLARFFGKQLHSKSFRRGETYKGQRVLVIGLGPSGLDITYKLIPHAKQVILSHNFESLRSITPPKGVEFKPAAASMFENTVTFVDGSSVEADVVIHCTGYTYNFPFLTKDCGLVVNQNVSPLYLHLFNIEAPTMAVLGLPRILPYQYCIDYQVRTLLAVLKGEAELPPQEEMLKESEEDFKNHLESGGRRKDYHRMGKKSKQYFETLQKLGNLPPVPEVRYNIFFDAFSRAVKDFEGFRFTRYKILDDERFEVEMLEKPPPPPVVEEVAQVETVPEPRTEPDGENRDENVILKADEHTAVSDVEPCSPTSEVEQSEAQRIVDNVVEIAEKMEILESTISEGPPEETTISTIQSAMTSDVKEFIESSSRVVESVETSSSEFVETSTSEVVQTIIKRSTVQETVTESSVNSMQVEAVVENSYRHEGMEKCEKILNGEQLSEGIVTKKEEVTVKHR